MGEINEDLTRGTVEISCDQKDRYTGITLSGGEHGNRKGNEENQSQTEKDLR